MALLLTVKMRAMEKTYLKIILKIQCRERYVVFSYEEELFSGVITHVTKTAASISAMQKCGRLWKWPQKVDLLDYNWEDVLYHINEPLKMSQTRNVYSVPELDFLWN